MTKEAFQKLGFPEKVFDMSFDVKDDYKEVFNQKLSQIIQKENIKWGVMVAVIVVAGMIDCFII